MYTYICIYILHINVVNLYGNKPSAMSRNGFLALGNWRFTIGGTAC